MYLIRSKKTGLFYRNCGRKFFGRMTNDGPSELWSGNPNDCKPFKSISGAKNSRIVRRVRPVMVDKAEVDMHEVRWKHHSPPTIYGYGSMHGESRTIYVAEGGELFYYERVPFDEYLELVPIRTEVI